jgi:hypothetical protein
MTKILSILIIIIAIFWYNSINSKNTFSNNKKSDLVGIKEKQENETIFTSLDKIELLNRLFDKPKFDTTGIAIWEPNFAERMDFPISFDNKCHTALDTIMYFIDRDTVECSVVIFRTYQIDENNNKYGSHFEGSPVSVAIFYKYSNNKFWELYKFSKYLTSLGYYVGAEKRYEGKLSLIKIANNWTCLILKQEIGGTQGEFSGYESWYSIERVDLHGSENKILSNIFNYTYYHSISSYTIKEVVYDSSYIQIIKNPYSYYDIKLVSKSNTNDRINISDDSVIETNFIKKNSVIIYKYSEENCIYEKE